VNLQINAFGEIDFSDSSLTAEMRISALTELPCSNTINRQADPATLLKILVPLRFLNHSAHYLMQGLHIQPFCEVRKRIIPERTPYPHPTPCRGTDRDSVDSAGSRRVVRTRFVLY
jgi:hypothetical protein